MWHRVSHHVTSLLRTPKYFFGGLFTSSQDLSIYFPLRIHCVTQDPVTPGTIRRQIPLRLCFGVGGVVGQRGGTKGCPH